MEGKTFDHCCGAAEVGGFWGTYEEGNFQADLTRNLHESMQIATLNSGQMPEFEGKLVRGGFVRLGEFRNKNTGSTVYLFARGLTLEKGAGMKKKTKKTITLKTGKKIVKKVSQ